MTEWPKLYIQPAQGAFDLTYVFSDMLSEEQLLCMGEWLSYHCQQNFIFLEKSSRILAGGTSNNRIYWDYQLENKTPATIFVHDTHTRHEIRLHSIDQAIFEMTWGNLILDNR